MSKKIVVSTRLPNDPVGSIRSHPIGKDAEIIYFDEARVTQRSELINAVKGANGILCTIPDTIDCEILDAAGPSLEVVANFGAGYDNIDVGAAHARNVVVTNTPHAVTESTADIAWFLTLAVARRTRQGEEVLRAGQWDGWHPTAFIGKDLFNKTLLVVGMGSIGTAVARRAVGWNMKILYTARTPKPEAESAPIRATRVELEEGLAEADIVSLNCPLTDDTFHLMNADRIGLMKPSAILINTARGPIIDEDALVKALAAEQIYGAGLDVFENEPAVHPDLLTLHNVVLLPHMGSSGELARQRMTELAVENLLEALSGKTPPNRIHN